MREEEKPRPSLWHPSPRPPGGLMGGHGPGTSITATRLLRLPPLRRPPAALTADREPCDSVSGGQSVILLFLAPGLGLGEGRRVGRRTTGRTQQRGESLKLGFRLPDHLQ